MNKYIKIALTVLVAVACNNEKWPDQPDWDSISPDAVPAEVGNRVVAHRGGASESGLPDNSLAALTYSINLGCYGSECDVYCTKDNQVIVAHANSSCQVNGLVTYENTLADIRAVAKLSNGEEIPTLEDFIRTVMQSNTKLFIDIKRIDNAGGTVYVEKCAKLVCDLVVKMKATNYVMLLCTGYNQSVMKTAWSYALQAGLEMGMNSGKSAAEFSSLMFNWINLSAAKVLGSGDSAKKLLDSYKNAGISVSVYNVDKRSGDGNAVYAASAIDWYITNKDSFKCICTNYPQWLLEKLNSNN